jgi:ABC-type transport system substrate-binding protein/ABC-type dipeptide/oligopeptide/nickel transport system permease component/tetratricopeptide (TPR) repeat protein
MSQRQDFLGNRVTADNDRTLLAIDDFVGGFLAYETRALGILAAADLDQGNALANAYAGILHMLLEAPVAPANALPYLHRAQRASADRREQGAVRFLQLWREDDVPGALRVAEDIVAEFPRDLVMVKLHQYLCFNLGDFAGMRRIAEAALPASADVAYLHGMLAFAHEQNHRLREAEASGRRALSLSEREPWAQHALAHVMLTEGRIDEGIAFLDGVSHHWTGLNSFMLTHLWWHQALFYLEQGRLDEALALYDRECWGVEKAYSQDQIGAVSLLARIELAGGDVGGRWAELAPWLAARGADTVQPFLSLQYLYGLARAGESQAAHALLSAIRERALTAPDFVRPTWAGVAAPAAAGLIAHAEGDYAKAAEGLEKALPNLAKIGGSHAQRDLFERFWKHATLSLGVILLAFLLALPAAARDALTLGTQLEPPGLDPTASASTAIGELTFPQVYESLVHLGPDGAVEPGLATRWEISPDLLTYRFHLRQGVRFHDGSAFDASSAKFSIERILDAKSLNPQRPLFECIGSAEAADSATLELHLKRPCSGLLPVLGWSAGAMVSPASAATNAAHPIGTGPFRFEEWRRGASVSLVKNPDYWGGTPPLARITYRFMADPSASIDALAAGDIDGYATFPAPEAVDRLKRDPRFHLEIAPTEGKTILALNNKKPPLDDIRVRQALSYAIDRRAIIDAAMFGYGRPIGSHYATIDPGYVDLTGLYPYDPAKARRLLAESGHADTLHLVLKLPPLSYARRSGEVVAAQLAEIGVKVELVPMEWVGWLGEVYARHDFDMTIVAHVEPMDYGVYGRESYYFGYGKPAFKELLTRLDSASDDAQRLTLLGEVQRMIAEDAVNVFLFELPGFSVWDERVHDIWYRTPVQIFDLAHAHFADPTPDAGAATRNSNGKIVLGAAVGIICALFLALLVRAGPTYAARRGLGLAATLLVASLVIFLVVQLAPGDPARFMLGMNADETAVSALRGQLGLDQPLPGRYLAWLAGLVTGDFGTSWTYRVPIGSLILQRLEVSLPLTLLALLFSTAIALGLALAAMLGRGRWFGRVADALTGAGIAIPNFWLGILLVGVFGVSLHWFSAGGFAGWEAGHLAALRSLTLPAIALAVPQGAILARLLRTELIEALGQDFVRTARAKGLSRQAALLRHALPASLPPILTILGMQFSFLLAGGVLIENVFFLPGLGRLVFEAIVGRDLIVVESVSVVLVFQVVVISLLADLASAAADPRLRDRVAA